MANVEETVSDVAQEEPATSVEDKTPVQEEPMEEISTPIVNEEIAEVQNEAQVQEEQKQETEEPLVTTAEEVVTNSENNSEEDVLLEDNTLKENVAEEVDNTFDEEKVLITDEEEKEDDEEDLSEIMPKQTFEEQIDNVHVKVTAGEGTFYSGTRMEAKLVENETIINSLENVVEDFVDTVVAVDITFYNEANEIIEPEKTVNVEITSDEINKMDDPVVAHLDNDGKKKRRNNR